MALKMHTSSIARPSKIYPNLEFWFEKYTTWQHCCVPELAKLGRLVTETRFHNFRK
jgi:hypothetical protein